MVLGAFILAFVVLYLAIIPFGLLWIFILKPARDGFLIDSRRVRKWISNR